MGACTVVVWLGTCVQHAGGVFVCRMVSLSGMCRGDGRDTAQGRCSSVKVGLVVKHAGPRPGPVRQHSRCAFLARHACSWGDPGCQARACSTAFY